MRDAEQQKFFDALAGMTSQEKLLMDVYANRHIGGTPFTSSQDLLHEVIVKVLDGDRHWPPDVELGMFIAGCVRSIASNSRKRIEMTNLPLDALHEDDSLGRRPAYEAVMSAEDAALLKERNAITHKAAKFARATLGNDEAGLQVLEAMLAGLDPRDMCSAFGMDVLAVKAARQRVVNRLKVYGARNPI